ncbi:MAG: hypothetical protein A2079_01365 [Geobacteraceae bacterium GWC2_48_7]|nr:MAG: hypothetical protein A2079_01365 [Geobacteraceae bacterium GWC2_48_7]
MKRLPIFLVALVGMISAACTTTTQIYEGPSPGIRIEEPSAPNAGIRYNSVAILDRNLQTSYVYEDGKMNQGNIGKIAVENAGARRSPTGTVEAWTILRNRTNHTQTIEGRVIFFDKNKGPLEGPTEWQRVFLPPNSINTYKEFSTSVTEVGYYYIEIREGR